MTDSPHDLEHPYYHDIDVPLEAYARAVARKCERLLGRKVRRNPVGRLAEITKDAKGWKDDMPPEEQPHHYFLRDDFSMMGCMRYVREYCKRVVEGGLIRRTIRRVRDYFTRRE